MAGRYAKYRVTSVSRKAKEQFFGDRKVVIHPVTGTEVFADSDAALRKVGPARKTHHQVDMDHTIPIDRLAPVLEQIPLLTPEDRNAIINSKHNTRMMPRHLNRSKKAKTNLQLALSKEFEGPASGRVVLAKWDAEARTGVTGDVATRVSKNAGWHAVKSVRNSVKSVCATGETFATGAAESLEAGAIPLMVEGVHKLYQVATGEKKFEEAAGEMGRLTVEVAATGGTMKVVAAGAEKLLADSSSKLLRNLADSNQVTQIITFALTVKDSVVRYVNGELDGEQFFRAIGEDGVRFYAGMIGATIGQTLIPIPFVGAMIGSLVVSTACGALIQARHALVDAYKSLGEFDKKVARVNALAAQALAEMERQRIQLKQMIESHFAHWDEQVERSFEEMYQATLRNDAEGIASGLDRVAKLFGGSVGFKTVDEYADFLADPNATLKL